VDPFPSSYNVILASSAMTIQAGLLSDPVIGGKGMLRLNLGVASSSASSVTLTASDPKISIPSGVSIPAGDATQDVPFTIGTGFNPLHVFSLRAQLGTASATAYGTVAQAGSGASFQISLNNANESTGPGGTTSDYGLNISSINGYETTVQIQCQGLPVGASCQVAKNPAALLPGTFGTDSLTVAVAPGTQQGSYPFTIVATDGAITAQAKATLGVADFTVSVSPATLIAFPGQGASYSLTITPQNGWSQSVTIACSAVPAGPKCLLDGSALLPGTIPMSIDPQNAPAGNYSMNITATGSGVSHGTSASLKIEDATISLSKTSSTVSAGGSATLNLSLSSVNGFTDQFTFTCPNLPVGMVCAFSPASGALPANGTLSSVLTVQVNSRPTSTSVFRPSAKTPSTPQVRGTVLWIALVITLTITLRGFDKRRGYRGAILAFACVLLLSICSCGGGGSSSSSSSPPPPPTPSPTAVVVKFQVQATSPSLTRTSDTITITVP
jgi:hypothetical protein